MIKLFLTALVMVSFISGCDYFKNLSSGSKSKSISLKTDKDKASYAIGQQIGKGMKAQGIEINSDVLASSINDVLTDKKSLMDDKEIMAAIQKLQKSLTEKRTKDASANKEKGAKFLAENKKKKGIITTASGLQYEVLKTGKGPKPKKTDTVKVHYKGTLIDGKEFDSSYKRNKPAEFPLNGVIPGWTEGLQLMNVGSKLRLYVPAKLAYGSTARPNIPANSVLIFDIELLDIVKKGSSTPKLAPKKSSKKKK